jgi:hypothetical protein
MIKLHVVWVGLHPIDKKRYNSLNTCSDPERVGQFSNQFPAFEQLSRRPYENKRQICLHSANAGETRRPSNTADSFAVSGRFLLH